MSRSNEWLDKCGHRRKRRGPALQVKVSKCRQDLASCYLLGDLRQCRHHARHQRADDMEPPYAREGAQDGEPMVRVHFPLPTRRLRETFDLEPRHLMKGAAGLESEAHLGHEGHMLI